MNTKYIYKSLTFLLLLFIHYSSTAQFITTIAGTGVAGYSGDGGPATAAQLNGPQGVIKDHLGNIYIADAENHCIRFINTTGIIRTVAGNGTGGYTGDGGQATNAELGYPANIAVDYTGNIYIVDVTNNCIRKVTASTGIINTIAGTGISGYNGDGILATTAQLYFPSGIDIDGSGDIYISDEGNARIRLINTSGIISTFAGRGSTGYSGDGGLATAGNLAGPLGIILDASDNLFIADQGNERTRQVAFGSEILSTYAGNGTAGYIGDGIPATTTELNQPYGVAADGLSNIYIADFANNRIRKVIPSGTISTIAGTGTAGFSGDGGPATIAQLNHPAGVGQYLGDNGVVYSRPG